MSDDLRRQLEASIGTHFRIERELGGGGMARVFVAHEAALNRRVVIKVLEPQLAAELSAKRFNREIQLAASLQQANIVPVLAAGDASGLPHYIMPFVDGLSLRERLARSGPPPTVETIAILTDVARALAYAHERGVVHRDIKPDNVLLSGDAAVVTDFGIAKAISVARTESREPRAQSASPIETLTHVGTSVGTPAYMAPEQIAGDAAIDHRADLYSFGCLAYELIAGKPPFTGSNVQSLFAAHLSEAPAPIAQRHPDVPPALATLVMRCLAKEPANRPQTAREILQALQGATTSTSFVGARWQRLSSTLVVAGSFAAAALVFVLVRQTMTRPVPPPVVVVIPFINIGGDSADDYLADGMADGLATALGKVPGIRVASRSLGYRYRGRRDLDAREVGRELSATHMLQGTLRRVQGRLLVSAQLINASTNGEDWSDTYFRNAADAYAVQDEITRFVAEALPRRLAAGASAELPRTASSGTNDPDAYDLYLRGRFLLQRRGRGVRQALAHLEKAIARDSTFAHAHAAYALGLELLPYFERVSADSLGNIAIPAARRALTIDSTIAEAHTALGLAYQHRYDWRAAEASYRRAIAAEPPDADAYIQYGRFLFYTRTVNEAMPMFQRAVALDPNSAVASAWVGHMHELSGRANEAMVSLRRAMEIDSTNPPSLVMIAQAHHQAGRRDSALLYAERLWRVWPQWRNVAASLFARMGDRQRAESLAAVAGPARFLGGGMHAALGDSIGWFESRERATAAREIWPTYVSLNEREVDFMRGSARFAAIVRGVGLDERIFTSPSGGRPR
jgi:TolB-like protein/Tfp pilus assembly protein PilF/tRNA A-37 threonylcarbamoyl transferase component Bud32